MLRLAAGLTVITSLKDNDLLDIGLAPSVRQQVERLASLAASAGCRGVVASAHEAAYSRVCCREGLCWCVREFSFQAPSPTINRASPRHSSPGSLALPTSSSGAPSPRPRARCSPFGPHSQA